MVKLFILMNLLVALRLANPILSLKLKSPTTIAHLMGYMILLLLLFTNLIENN